MIYSICTVYTSFPICPKGRKSRYNIFSFDYVSINFRWKEEGGRESERENEREREREKMYV